MPALIPHLCRMLYSSATASPDKESARESYTAAASEGKCRADGSERGGGEAGGS